MQPKKSAWSVGSKGASTSTKKESWRDWKVIQEKKKKQGASSSDNDTSDMDVVHRTGIVVVVSTRSWASVASSDDDNELLPSLRSTSISKRAC